MEKLRDDQTIHSLLKGSSATFLKKNVYGEGMRNHL